MKKIAFAVPAMFVASTVFAANQLPEMGAVASQGLLSAYDITVSATAHNELYEEFVPGAKLMKEEARMAGLKFGISRGIEGTGSSLGLTAHIAKGSADYTGSYWGGEYGSLRVGGLDRTLFELEATYKHTTPAWRGVTPSVGLGYRFLEDRLDQAGPGGYERENDRVYLALGVERTFPLGQAWSVTPVARYKHSLWSQQYSDILGGVIHRQTKGSGYDVSVEFAYKQPTYTLAVTPYLRAWDMADSTVVANTYEPENETRELGFELSTKF